MKYHVYSWCPARGECVANAVKFASKRRRLREEYINAASPDLARAIFFSMHPDQRTQFTHAQPCWNGGIEDDGE